MSGYQLGDSQDQYGGQYATNILLEKRARRLAEDDALRLYNRVRQLQKEEGKAQKRIQETKKKAKQIIRYRERNELVKQAKEERYKQLQLDIERQKAENLKAREEVAKNKTEQENRVWADKYTVAQQTKEERAELEKLLLESRLLARKEALEQKEAVQRAQEEARKRIEQLKIDRLQMAQEEYERRLREEMEAKAAKEAEIERLAKIEMELIERLKSKQQEQRRAYQQLEAVLSLGSSSASSRVSSKQQSPRGGSPGPGALTSAQEPASGEPTDEDVARAFSIYDDDALGEIPAASLDSLLKDLGVTLAATQLSQAIAQLDVGQKGAIAFGEFLLWWKG